MPRVKIFHKVTVKLPNGKIKKTRSIGCKPYAVAVRWTIKGHKNQWKVYKWCSTWPMASDVEDDLKRQYANWKHKQVEVSIMNTSCHITTGTNAEGR